MLRINLLRIEGGKRFSPREYSWYWPPIHTAWQYWIAQNF